MKRIFPLFLLTTFCVVTPSCKKKYLEGYDAGFSQGHEQGYDETYDSGYSDGKEDGLATGYESGYTLGHSDGYTLAWGESRDLFASDVYELGFIDGNRFGFQDGFAVGNADGLVVGFNDGTADGYSDGYNTGYNIAYADGRSDGYSVGYNHGYGDGYDDGEDDGYNDGYDDGWDDRYYINYDNGYDDGYDEGWDDGDYDGYGDGYDDAYAYYNSTASKNPMVRMASALNADLIDYSKLKKFDTKSTIETGLVFNREGRSVDMEKLASLKERHYLNEMSKQIQARFALSTKSSQRIATIAHQYNKLSGSRELTKEDASNFSKELVGFDMNQIQNAFRKSMKGDSKDLNSLLDNASKKVGTDSEKFNQMINEIFF